MEITAKQVQSLLDAGYGVNRISILLNTHHEKISRMIRKNKLEIYVAFDERLPQPPVTWIIESENFRVRKSDSIVGYRNKEDAMRDAISEFVRTFDPDEITSQLLKEFRYIERYVYTLHNGMADFLNYYDLSGDMISYSRESKLGLLMRLGCEFERLVKEIFDYLSYDYVSKYSVDNCRPDFVVGSTWYDAKLSKSTVHNNGCETLEKYTKHTDALTIIYAIDDSHTIDDRCDFISIEDYKPHISTELRRKVDAFVRKAEAVRYGGAA